MTTSTPAPLRFRRSRAWLVASVVVTATMTLGACAGSEPVHRAAPAPVATSAPSAAAVAAPPPAPVTSMARSVPTRLRIPAIAVDTDLMALGLEKGGALQTPPGAFPAGWFTGAPTPGELGPAIIAGHVRYRKPGVFARLSELRREDRIHVARTDGSTATFRVTGVERFEKARFPTRKVYGNLDHAGLRLITCGGLVAGSGVYEDNVVVFAELLPSA